MNGGKASGGRVGVAMVGEAELAVRFAAGEPDCVTDVYRAYGRLVYAVAYRVLGDVSLAEDATQQTFVQAWQNSSRFDPARSLGPWLATIAGRAAIDTYRRNRRHRESRNVDDLDLNDPGLASLPPSAEGIYDAWQVRRALDTLPDHDRELIRLQHYGQLTHVEIAERLAIPVGTVKSRSFRAHRRLAGLLGHLRNDPESRDTGIDVRSDLTEGGVRHD
jgi:RNA polymerase sigma factor (sigma-70 family)